MIKNNPKELNASELAQLFLEQMTDQYTNLLSQEESNCNKYDKAYHLLDHLTHAILQDFSRLNETIDIFMLPMDENKFPINWKYKDEFKDDILPDLLRQFQQKNLTTLDKFTEKKHFKPIDYGYIEQIEKSEEDFNAIFLRIVWQCINYWSKQEGMSLEEKMICYQENFLMLMGGNELIPKNILIPILKPSEKQFLISKSKNYSTTDNYHILHFEEKLIATGYGLDYHFYLFAPTLEKEAVYLERHTLNEQLTNHINKNQKLKL